MPLLRSLIWFGFWVLQRFRAYGAVELAARRNFFQPQINTDGHGLKTWMKIKATTHADDFSMLGTDLLIL